jgi:hypothetical protein
MGGKADGACVRDSRAPIDGLEVPFEVREGRERVVGVFEHERGADEPSPGRAYTDSGGPA